MSSFCLRFLSAKCFKAEENTFKVSLFVSLVGFWICLRVAGSFQVDMNRLQMIVKCLAFIAYDKLTEILKVILTKRTTYKKGFCHFAGFSFPLHQTPDMYKLLRAAFHGRKLLYLGAVNKRKFLQVFKNLW